MVLSAKFILLLTACLLAGCTFPSALDPTSPPIPPAPLPASTFTPPPIIALTATTPPTLQTYPPTATRAPTGTPYPTATATPLVVGLFNFPPDVNPLTGLKVSNPALLNRRPVMVKVSNYPATMRPHAGLSFADLVFEYYIGEYANRFSAVFYSQDAKKIGPLRSGRLVDADLALAYNALLIYGNADPRVDEVLVKALGSRAISIDDAPCPPVCGVETHATAGVWVDSSGVNNFAAKANLDNHRPNLNGMIFDARPPLSNQAGTFLGVMFGPQDRGEWRYDSSSGNYLRWIEEIRAGNKLAMIPLVDRLTNKQLSFSNIVILFARHTELLPTMFDVEINQNQFGQRAVFFRDGLMVEGIWRARDSQQPIQLLNQYGLSMVLKPGPTWFVIVGLGSPLTSKTAGQWELEYHTK